MMDYRIMLPAAFAERHRHAVEQYIQDARLTSTGWQDTLEAFDLLGQAQVQAEDDSRTFAAVYYNAVEEPIAADFLARLLQLADPEREGIPLKAAYARTIADRLVRSGWYDPTAPYSLYLRAYCIFGWDSFAKGYIFEVAVYRDLKAAGVTFVAHDITDPVQRRLSFDLVVSNWRGDIKASSYFLAMAYTRIPQHDFYITRLYDHTGRRRVWAVIMQPEAWAAINGETEAADLSQAHQHFPAVSHFYYRGRRLVVAAYGVWKAKILAFQQGAK
jgi:hypothetical protein